MRKDTSISGNNGINFLTINQVTADDAGTYSLIMDPSDDIFADVILTVHKVEGNSLVILITQLILT